MIYASAMFKVATSDGLVEYTITRNVTSGKRYRQTDVWTDDGPISYEINIPYFCNEKVGIIRSKSHFHIQMFTEEEQYWVASKVNQNSSIDM